MCYSIRNKKKVDKFRVEICQLILVEVRGVEPLSENNFTGLSPGADGYFGRRYRPVPLPLGKPSRPAVR